MSQVNMTKCFIVVLIFSAVTSRLLYKRWYESKFIGIKLYFQMYAVSSSVLYFECKTFILTFKYVSEAAGVRPGFRI